MKAFLTIILTICCVTILILGNIHWGNKTKVDVEKSHKISVQASDAPAGKESLDEDEIAEILSYAANWPEKAITSLEGTLKKGKTYKIIFAGSEALGEGPTSWPAMVQESLVETYGENIFTFRTKTYDKTSTEFLEAGGAEELAKEKADLIVFEPFTLKDNGKVVIETSWENILDVMENVKADKPDTTFILQPPHPIYEATWYQFQVENLEKFAEDAGIPYLNHWEAWPSVETAELNSYLTEERDAPNEKGHEIWADYLIDYFIAE